MPMALHSDFCMSYTVRAIEIITNSDGLIPSSTGLIREARALLRQLDDRLRPTHRDRLEREPDDTRPF